MAKVYRECSAQADFNTGHSKCPLLPGKIKAIILTLPGYKIPSTLTVEAFEKAIHADRPARIFPIKTVAEYASSGGDAETSARGYGASQLTGYSAKTDTLDLEEFDTGLRANLVATKGVGFNVYFVNSDNVIFGEKDNDGTLRGVELSGIYVSGQDFDSSGDTAYISINLMYKDIERYWKYADSVQVDFDLLSILEGLVYVNVEKVEGATNKYKIIEDRNGLDRTAYDGNALAESACWENAESVSYSNGELTITTTGSGTPRLKSPSVLLENGVTGIEQISA